MARVACPIGNAFACAVFTVLNRSSDKTQRLLSRKTAIRLRQNGALRRNLLTDLPNETQYSLTKIMTIWLAATLPMSVLMFGAAPYFFPGNLLAIWCFAIAGMVWQFLLSVTILCTELERFSWHALSQRIWLQKPQHPATGRRSYWLFLWLIPAYAFYALIELTPLVDAIGSLILIPFPFVASLPKLSLSDLPASEFVGAWWLIGLALLSCIFNYFLGEELLFRGILLPKMRGVFGRWDWLANAVLFAVYHLHRPFHILAFVVGGIAWSLPSRYFKSIWFAIVPHAIEGVALLVPISMIVLGYGAFK